MEKNQLRYAVESARYLNMTKAAEALHITQPSLSIQLSNLEDELGIKLFERSKRGLHVTEAGTYFVQQASHILNMMDALTQEMNSYKDMEKGSLRIGLPAVMFSLKLPELLHTFETAYPKIEMTLVESGSRDLLEQVQQRILDTAFIVRDTTSKETQNVHSVLLIKSKCMAIIPKSNPLATSKKPLSISDLANQQLILTQNSFNMQRILLAAMDTQNIPYKILMRSNQLEGCFALPNQGLGISICSEETAHYYHQYKNVIYREILGIPPREIHMIYAKDPNICPPLAHFIENTLKHFHR